MKAVGLYKHLPINDPHSLVDCELPDPVATEQDLLVRIKAISVNPVDTKIRAPKEGSYDPAKILGWDAAGMVESVGDAVTLFTPGDEVYYAGDITRPGSNAELQLIDERLVGKKPASLCFKEAAALPLTTITAWEAIFDRLGIVNNKGNRAVFLIIGGAGGVGSMATQIGKTVPGLTLIATASRGETVAWCKKQGADFVIDHHQPLLPQIKALNLEVDYIFCCNNTDSHWNSMAELIRPQGKICTIVDNSGPLDMQLLKTKSLTHVWEFMYTRSMFKTDDMHEQGALLNRVSELVDDNIIATTMQEDFGTINAKNLRKAHARVEEGSMIGKLVLGGN